MRYFVNRLESDEARVQRQLTNESESGAEARNLYRVPLERFITAVLKASHEEDGGIYVGSAGVAYALWRASLSTIPISDNVRQQCATEAIKRIQASAAHFSRHSRAQDDGAFVLGGCGAYVVAALARVNDEHARKRIAALGDKMLPVHFSRHGDDELFVGRAGFLAAIAVLRQHTGHPIINDEQIVSVLRSMVQSGREHATKHKHVRTPLMYAYYGTEYMGAAHGIAGILQMMLNFPQHLQVVDERAWADVQATVDWLVSAQERNGNWAPAVDEIGVSRGENELVHWCHGAPGVIYAVAAAHLAYGAQPHSKYLQSCLAAGELIWQKGLLRKGPGLCHGVTGNAYAFLLLYRLTHDKRWLARAHAFVHYLCTDQEFHDKALMRPDNPLSLHEGIAGTLCLLSDLATPEQAHFPLHPLLLLK